jgi:hypothetical protein
VTGLSQGNYYKFKVQSRNAYGYCGEHGLSSEFSEELIVLAAQIPDVPTAATTEFIPQSTSPIEDFQLYGDLVKASWTAPDARGSPISAYTVYFRAADGSFLTLLDECDGSD